MAFLLYKVSSYVHRSSITMYVKENFPQCPLIFNSTCQSLYLEWEHLLYDVYGADTKGDFKYFLFRGNLTTYILEIFQSFLLHECASDSFSKERLFVPV